MQLPLAATFVDKASGVPVPGRLEAAVEKHLLLWTGWRYDAADQDRGWDWWGIYGECRSSRSRYECYAAMAANNLQGFIVLDLRGKGTKIGEAVVVDYLATNPINRAASRGLKYVGLALMAIAINRSNESGRSGRIWLESLPGAAGFYGNLGMEQQPRRSADGNLVFVLDAITAEQLLEKIKENRIIEA